MNLLLKKVERPRELKWHQAGAMLYGDWGTSKAYVLGLAFAIAGHASMFYLAAMAVLTTLIGYCYAIVCRAFPDGGGVYSSAKSVSKHLAVVGALLLVADYVITAALSSLEAFHYFGFEHAQWWAIGSLGLIGLINIFGPTKSGNLASVVAVTVAGLLGILAIAVIPSLGRVEWAMPEGPIHIHWSKFVGIVLALSGVEAIANVTGIMVKPVDRTSRRAIFPVMLEVAVISLVLGAAMNAIPGLSGRTEDMLRAIADHYVGPWFGHVIALAIGFLLLSACNTAVSALVSITFLLAKDRELPPVFAQLNRYGMPWFGLAVAALMPMVVLLVEHDLTRLAALYAIGVVGAIMINLWATGTNRSLPLGRRERFVLLAAAAVMIAIEATIVAQKHHAVVFALTIVGGGLILRAVARRVVVPALTVEALGINVLTIQEARDLMPLYKGSTLVPIKTENASLVEEAALHAKGKGDNVVYTLYVEEKPPGWAYPEEAEPSGAAVDVLRRALKGFEDHGVTCVPLWAMGDNAGELIVRTAKDLHLDTVMIGSTRRGALERLLRGEVLKNITRRLPREKHLIICN